MDRMRTLAALFGLVALGCAGEETQSNTNLPIAKFTATPTEARPQVFKLDASESFATVGEIASYRWTFGDEVPGTAAKETDVPAEVHAYAAAGTYTLTLVVVDDVGTPSEPATQEVTVTAVNTDAPKAVIAAPADALPGSQVSFDGSASTPAGDLEGFAWDFGDPASGTLNQASGANATHIFVNPGSYAVNLTVTDSLGQSDTAEHLIVVGQVGPIASCTFSPNPPSQGAPVTFDGSASTAPDGASIQTYIWDFDDGSPQATGATVTHTYNVQATFQPTLQVIDTQNRVANATCPEVVVGAPDLCVGEYTLTANPDMQSCSGSPTTWGGVKIHLDEKADNTMVGTETFASQTITYSGTWAGLDFTLTGSYSQPDGLGGTIDTQATIQGTFSGCGGWTGTWKEEKTWSGFALCTLTWNVAGTRL